MKRIAWSIVIGLTLLVSCQNTEPKEETKQSTEQNQQETSTKTETNAAFPYPNLLSESEQT
jgi:PBP1b-binding outer membrane lipoprotein LpoB